MKRTRQLLQNGLRELLQQKPLHEILVQEIADAATVNRATFYDHYTDKLDLFNSLIGADFEKLLEQRKICFDGGCFSSLNTIVLAVGDFLQHLHNDHATCTQKASSEPLIDAAITLAVRKLVLKGLEKQARQSALPREVAAAMAAGAIYAAVKECLSTTNWQVDEKTLASIAPLIRPVLEQGAPPPGAQHVGV